MEESPLDEVAAACMELDVALRAAKTEVEKDALLTKHIEALWESGTSVGDFDKNTEWVNVPERISLERDCRDKIVVLDFFTYCCINCYHILPDLRALEEAHPVAAGLVVIGVHSAKFDNEKETDNILSCVKRYDIRHPVVNEPESQTWTRLGVRCWPTLLILGPQLKPIFVITGEGHRNELLLYCGAAVRHFREKLSHKELAVAPMSHVAARPVDKLRFPSKVALNPFYRGGGEEPFLAISDTGNHRVVLTDYSGLTVRIVGGLDPGFKDGKSWEALFNSPQGLCWLSGTVLVVCDTGNHALRSIDLDDNSVELLCGTGEPAAFSDRGGDRLALQPLSSPWDVALFLTADMDLSMRSPLVPPPRPPHPPPPPGAPADKEHDGEPKGKSAAAAQSATDKEALRRVLLIACAGSHQIWALFLDTTIWWKYKKYEEGTCVCIAGNRAEAARNSNYPQSASFAQPSGLALKKGTVPELFIADSESSSIRRISLGSGQVLPVAGGDRNPLNLFAFGDKDGISFDAKFQHPLGVAYSEQNKSVYVADTYNNAIKRIDITTYRATTLRPVMIETDVPVKFNEPSGLSVSNDSKYIYVADTNNHSIKIFNLTKNVCQEFNFRLRTVAGDDIKSTVPYNRDLYINKNCGTIILMFTVKLDSEKNDVELMSGAPQYWNVKMEDESGEDVTSMFDLVNCALSGNKLPARIHLKLKNRTTLNVFTMNCTFRTSICGNKCFFYSFGVSTHILVRESVKPVESFKIGFRFNPHDISSKNDGR